MQWRRWGEGHHKRGGSLFCIVPIFFVMEPIITPLDDRIALSYGKPVRMVVSITEMTPFGVDTLRFVHEGILSRRSCFGDENKIDTVEFHFSGSSLPVVIEAGQFDRSSADFLFEEIKPFA